jgi:ATP-binding cassette subfamily B (MDR/TAP) protein 1
MSESLRPVIFWFLYLGAAATVAGYMEIACWELAGMRQANRIRCVRVVCVLVPNTQRVTRTARLCARRRQYLTALLRQEMAFFDSHDSGALLARVVTDTNAIQEALSSKCPNLIHHGCAGLIGIIIGLARGWQMALVTMSTLPLMGASRARR